MDQVLDSAGNQFEEAAIAVSSQKIIYEALSSDNPEHRQAAQTWNNRIWSAPTVLTMLDHISAQFPVPEETLIPALSPDKVPLDFINIGIEPNPQPQQRIQNESAAQQDVSNGFVVNTPSYQIAFTDGTLDKTDFASAQIGSLATGGLRPGEIQLDPNARPSQHLAEHYRAAQADFFGVSNAIVLNGLAAQTTHNVFVDPLLLDLTGQGIQLAPISDGVLFDVDHSGTLKRTGWADRTTGMLVLDDGSGQVIGVHQMFSEYYGGQAGKDGQPGERPFKDGFEALNSVDGNADRMITAADPVWAQLRVWVDASHDGQSVAGELKTLDEWGITQIQVSATPVQSDVRQGNTVQARGSFVINGETREALAVSFLADTVSSLVTHEAGAVRVVSRAGDVSTTAYASLVDAGQTLDAQQLGVGSVYGGKGNDRLQAAQGGSWLVGGEGSNTYVGGAGDDVFVISATDNPDDIQGNGGRDTALIVGDKGMVLNLAKAGLTIAQGGQGVDWLIAGGKRSAFLKGGAAGAVLIGGGGRDVLSGGSGPNTIIGGHGMSVIYAGPMGDKIQASAQGSIIYAGKGNDFILGKEGNDVIEVGQGNATIDGGGGVNSVTLHGSYGEYSITAGAGEFRVADNVQGRDGTVTLRNVQQLNFQDISSVVLGSANSLPVSDAVYSDIESRPIERNRVAIISASALLANDLAMASQGPLRIAAVGDAVGGSVAIDPNGNVLFTPVAELQSAMGFKYEVVDSQGTPALSVVDLDSGKTAILRANVTLHDAQSPKDPFAGQQWYLGDINVFPVWQDYTGKGVRIAQFEPGGEFSVAPEIFDINHPDLAGNVDQAWLRAEQQAGSLPALRSNHATQVAGVMVAARNETGGVGIAHGATLAGHHLGSRGMDLVNLGKMVSYDIANNSWGFTRDFAVSNLQEGRINTASALVANAQYAASNGRGGLGTVIVASGGNSRAKGGSAQGSFTSNNRFTVEVAAINAQSDLSTLQVDVAPFSNPGTSLLVAAPGSNVLSTSRKIETERGSIFGSDYSATQGTSFAAPIVSGVIALMLEANPNLGYRDVQQILALSARRVDGQAISWSDNGTRHWNGGAMHKSDDYGFGKVDARAAVRMAEGWMKQSTAANEAVLSSPALAIGQTLQPGQTLSSRHSLPAGIHVEHVEVDFDADLGKLGDLNLTLVSPTGTSSTLLNRHGQGGTPSDAQRHGPFKYSFMTTHHWGEASAGEWTLNVTNAETGAPLTVNTWAARLYGENDAVTQHVLTDEFSTLAAADPGRLNIGAGDGVSVFNAAAVSGAVEVNLEQGTATLSGAALTLANPTRLQAVITGDGDDSLTAGPANTLLNGGRGSNTLTGGAGTDVFVIAQRAGGSDRLINFSPVHNETINLVGFEGLAFSALKMSDTGEGVSVALGAGQSLSVSGLKTADLNEGHFKFQNYFSGPQASFYSEQGTREPALVEPARVVMSGGAGGISITSEGGQFVAALTGVIYSRPSIDAYAYVVARQQGVAHYKNALRGFRQGVDKIDVSQTGARGLGDLVLTDVKRATINGLSLIHGLELSTQPADGATGVTLAFLDAVGRTQLGEADFIFAPQESGPALFNSLLDAPEQPALASFTQPQMASSVDSFIQSMATFAPQTSTLSPVFAAEGQVAPFQLAANAA
ncbi:MAG: S8 family serine peptidase [Pseudomonas sp.]|nr:S8 family serine peptidase [Pseudomonas sp.]